jgi:enoyl reductase-like protein
VAAGTPTTQMAAEITRGLKSVEIRHVAFKPDDSVDGIHQIVNIAAANPDFAITLQWTGAVAIRHSRCFINLSLPPIQVFAIMTILPLLPAPAFVLVCIARS